MDAETLLGRLGGVRRGGGGWIALCPAHDDKQPSLSVSVGEDGRILVKCHAGCSQKDVVDALGIEFRDLFPDGHKAPIPRVSAPVPVTVARLAEAKRLPLELLREAGVRNFDSGVLIPYVALNGSPARARVRTALKAKDGSRWHGSSGDIVPYGLARIGEVERQGFVFLVEGESDVWTLWHYELPAFGVPGVSMTEKLRKEHLEAVKQVFVVEEPDNAGAKFVRRIAARLSEVGWKGDSRVVALGMDINELHLKDPDTFLGNLRAACNASIPIEQASAGTSANSANVSEEP